MLHAHPRWLRAAALSLLLPAAACGNLTAGGYGEAHVLASGNYEPAPAPSPAPAPAPTAVSGSPIAPASDGGDDADQAEGHIEADFTAFLVSESGTATRLGRDDLEIRVDIQGREELEAERVIVPAIRYTAFRMIFSDIRVEVEDGLIINGVPIIGELHVEIDDANLLVERPIDVTVDEGQTVELVVDLNAPSWLAAVDPITRTISESVFADLVNVVVR